MCLSDRCRQPCLASSFCRARRRLTRTMRKLPRSVSFSYGKALQKTCIVTWMGKKENDGIAQQALKNRSKANSEATKGTYAAGTCASVGVDGNIKMAGGAY